MLIIRKNMCVMLLHLQSICTFINLPEVTDSNGSTMTETEIFAFDQREAFGL